MPLLTDLQRSFFGAIAHGHGDEASLAALAAEVENRGPLGVADRVGIYARMYCARLTEALAEDYPRVAELMGPDAFGTAAHGYVEQHPSTRPSLRWFGEAFADFLAGHLDPRYPACVADLARLEWARLGVFDAPDADILSLDDLRQVPAERWGTLRLEVVPAATVLHLAWPVHRIWDEHRAESAWAPQEIWVRVWRQGDQVFQAPMDTVERRAFHRVRQGEEFAALCAGLAAADVPADDVARTAGALVLRWIEDGLLRRTLGAF
jgi:hypothetical protein